MSNDFPQDSDGDALRGLVERGSDLSKPMLIDFQISVHTEAAANAIGGLARKLGYRVRTYQYPEIDEDWTCECSTRMLATYDGVLAVQRELAELSVELGGYPDGWGTFGNKPGAEPAAG
jgi:regulator of RNase E activity RraB